MSTTVNKGPAIKLAPNARALADFAKSPASPARDESRAGLSTWRGKTQRILTCPELVTACDAALLAGRRCAIMLCDIDQMAEINEAWGHAIGNRIIEGIRTRLLNHRSTAAASVVAQRHNGSYLILVDDVGDEDALLRQAGELAAVLSAPMLLDGVTVGASVSVGLALTPQHGTTTATLIEHVILATKRAKREGGGRLLSFDPLHAARLRERDAQLARVRLAMDRGDFRVAYQPIVDARGVAIGAEALLRCHGPNSLPISDTIAILEQSGLIVDVGLWVLREACRQAALWQTRRSGLSVHVNLSALQLRSRTLASDIDSALRRFELPPSALQLEITESSLLEGDAAILDNIERLKALGLHFWIDDFGTGYNSLSYLHQLPVSGIKIDRSFVSGALAQARGDALLGAMVRLAQQMSLDIIAEGVETESQARKLRALGVNAQQGFHYSEAALAPHFEEHYL